MYSESSTSTTLICVTLKRFPYTRLKLCHYRTTTVNFMNDICRALTVLSHLLVQTTQKLDFCVRYIVIFFIFPFTSKPPPEGGTQIEGVSERSRRG